MAKKLTAWQRAFRDAANTANKKCHFTTKTPKTFRTCKSTVMEAELNKAKKRLGVGKKKRKAAGASKAKQCAGLKRSRGRTVLRKGYTWKGHRGRCPRKVA